MNKLHCTNEIKYEEIYSTRAINKNLFIYCIENYSHLQKHIVKHF